jgi:serine/threonine protein kinase
MPLPRGDEYLAAVQNPRTAFSDTELKICTAETDQFGIPKPYSGGFTTTFHLKNHSQEWAARCFTRAIPDLQKRYEAIGRFLEKSSDGFFVKASCLPQGIRIGNQWQPIIKMQWLEGQTLNTYIDRNISNASSIAKLVPEFLNLVHRLEQLGIAHGDLQHGNILVKQGKLYLIDYDGIFLPELSTLKTNEIGHLNYQHPTRNATNYTSSIDRFSSIVIYLGLQSVSVSPTLWQKYDNSENILFRADDFSNVENSLLLSDLSTLPQLASSVERFRGVCKLDFDKIPSLDQFISGNFSYPKVVARVVNLAPPPPTVKRSQYLVLDATQRGSISEHIGERIEVVGLISTSRRGWARNRRPYVFINFGVYPSHTFTLVLWSTSLATFQANGVNPQVYSGKWVKVSGVIGSYRGKPQMTIDSPSQIQILAGQDEARQWLGASASVQSTTQDRIVNCKKCDTPNRIHPHPNNLRPICSKCGARLGLTKADESIFNTLYANRTSTAARQAATPVAKAKKKYETTPGIVGGVVLAIVGTAIWGIWGFIIGAVIGFQIGKRL